MNLRPSTGASSREPVDADSVASVALTGARPFLDIVIPRTAIKARLRLCSRREEFQAKAEARAAMLEAGYPVDGNAIGALGAAEQWLAEVMVRMLAIAVREPGTSPNPPALATLEDWQDCDDQQLIALWTMYQDHEHRHDPIGADRLTDEELAAIVAASKKKDADSLMAFGSRRLALYAITTASPPASSAIPPSQPGRSPA